MKAQINNAFKNTLPEPQKRDLSDDTFIDQVVERVLKRLQEEGLTLAVEVPPLDTLPEFLTPEQTQDVLQIGRATFFRWVKDNKLPGAVKIGNSWRVNRQQLKAYMQKNTNKGL